MYTQLEGLINLVLNLTVMVSAEGKAKIIPMLVAQVFEDLVQVT